MEKEIERVPLHLNVAPDLLACPRLG